MALLYLTDSDKQMESMCTTYTLDKVRREPGLLMQLTEKEQTEEMCMIAVEKDGKLLKEVYDQTTPVKARALFNHPEALQYVRDQTPEDCLIAVSNDGMALRYVKHQTERICLTAIRQNAEAIIYVKNQTWAIKRAAVVKDGMTLRFITFPTEQLIELALRRNPEAIIYVKEPSQEMITAVLNEKPSMISVVEQTEENRKLALEKDPYVIQYLVNPSDNEVLHALHRNPFLIVKLSREVQNREWFWRVAVKTNPEVMGLLIQDDINEDTTFECGRDLYKIDRKYIRYVKRFCDRRRIKKAVRKERWTEKWNAFLRWLRGGIY